MVDKSIPNKSSMKNMEHENKMVVRGIKDPRIVSKRDTRHEGSKEPQIANEISVNSILF